MVRGMEHRHKRHYNPSKNNPVRRDISIGGEATFTGTVINPANPTHSPSLDVNTDGGVQTFSDVPISSLTHIIINSAVPTTQSPTLLTNPTPAAPSSSPSSGDAPFSTPSPTSSSISPSTTPSPAGSEAETWAGSHKLTLAGIIAAFVALGLVLAVVFVVLCRRAKRKKQAEEQARGSFAAGHLSMGERPRSGVTGIMRRGTNRRTWDGLGSRDNIDASSVLRIEKGATKGGQNDDRESEGGLQFPMPPTTDSATPSLRKDKRNSLTPSLPSQPSHESFSLTGAFGRSGEDEDPEPPAPPAPAYSSQPLARLRTITPQRIDLATGKAEAYRGPDDPPSFISYPGSGLDDGSYHDPSPSSPHSYFTSSKKPKMSKAVRLNNIRALDNLIAALDDVGDNDGAVPASQRLPDPSMWRAALGTGAPDSGTGSRGHAAFDRNSSATTR